MKCNQWITQNLRWIGQRQPIRVYLLVGAAISSALALTLAACGGNSSSAVSPPIVAAALPTCSQMATDPAYHLRGNANVIDSTLTTDIIAATPAVAANPAGSLTAIPATPAYCQVNFLYTTGLVGPAAGYDQGQTQLIKIRLYLPLSLADGGNGAMQGNWIGKQMVGASAGSSGSSTSWASYSEGTTMNGPTYAIRLGYIAASTDTGQGNLPFGVIQTGALARTLSLGTIADWTHRGTHYGKQMAGAVANTYYGSAPSKVYYNGCSGGGNEGMGQLQNYGDEYDGALIAAPANHWQQFRLADSWPQIVFKKLVQKGDLLPTTAQMSSVNTAAIAACDTTTGSDTVADGIIADPRACTFSAKANVCGVAGAPAAPACITANQAAAFDRIWDGPRNKFGHRIWFPFDRGSNLPLSTTVSNSTTQVMQWNHKDTSFDGNNLFVDAESLALAGSPPTGITYITYEDEARLGSNTTADYTDNQNPALDKFKARNGKIIQIHGTQDTAIRFRHDVDYYRRVGTHFGSGKVDFASMQAWYRLFLMPGVGHCSGGVGSSAVDPFLAMVKWAEQGVAPDVLLSQGGVGAPVTRTRPLCPYPQTAYYKGSGSTDDAANFVCTGNLETPKVLCDSLRTKYKFENADAIDKTSLGIDASLCTGI